MISKISSMLKKEKYLTITIVTSIIFFSILYFLTVINVYQKSIFIYAIMNGTLFTIFSLLSSMLLSILLGVYLSLAIYRINFSKSHHHKSNVCTTGALAAGTIVTGCPSCGVPILALIGFPLALMSFPFKGLEIKFLSIFIIIISIYFLAKKLPRNILN